MRLAPRGVYTSCVRRLAALRSLLRPRVGSLAPSALVALTFWLVATSASHARACATCGAGDPLRQIAGAEQPFRGRVRLAVVTLHTSYSDADGEVFDQRALVGGSVAIDDVALLSAALPLVWRESHDPSLAHDTSLGVGDLDLRLRVTLFRERSFAPAHRLVLELGSRLPTAPELHRPDGSLAPLIAQTGTGAFEPLLGLAWYSRIDDTSLSLAAQGAFPTTGFTGWRNGVALRTSAVVQWQPIPELALRASLDARLEGPSGSSAQIMGAPTFLLHAGGGVVVAPSSDLVLHLVARVPVLGLYDASQGARWDGVSLEAGMALDV